MKNFFSAALVIACTGAYLMLVEQETILGLLLFVIGMIPLIASFPSDSE